MTHQQAFAAKPTLFPNPLPRCLGGLDPIFATRVEIVRDGSAVAATQEVFRCRVCGARIGLIDGQVRWAEDGRLIPGPAPTVVASDFAADRRLPPAAVRIAETLVAFADEEGRCRATNRAIAEIANTPKRTLTSMLRLLSDLGYLKIEGGYRTLNGRVLTIRKGTAPDGAAS